MLIGVPKETKTEEYRVGLTPAGARELVAAGHGVIVERGAGEGSGFGNEEYAGAGARVAACDRVWAEAELVIKVKEPQRMEYGRLRAGMGLFTYLHLAANPELAETLQASGVIAIAYETVTDDEGRLPLLEPMSEVAGRMSPLVAAWYLGRPRGGSGVLAAGAAGVPPAHLVVLGAGTVGSNAARVGHAIGMRVTVLSRGIERLRRIDEWFQGEVATVVASRAAIEEAVASADAVVGAVLVPGERAPVLIDRALLRRMRPGSVLVDVAIDQGGCAETSRPTTHADPVYIEEGVIHYTVANMPGAYPRTSTIALTNATLPYIKRIAGMGLDSSAIAPLSGPRDFSGGPQP